MMIFGLPVSAVLGAGLTCLGAYNFARYSVSKIEKEKRRVAALELMEERVEAAAELGAKVYGELKNPATRVAEIQKIAAFLHDNLSEAGVSLASSLEVKKSDPAPVVQG